MAVHEFAPAKVNLYLHVVGKRADGYHLLDSLVVFAGVGDDLAIEEAEELSLSLDGPNAGPLVADSDNLVLKAARFLAAEAGITPKAKLSLTKRLPVASGIGGGSADAAAALRGLLQLWRLNPAPEDLARIALKLGADVPVCLKGRPVFVGGVGEFLDSVPVLPACWMVLVNPGIPLSTPAVFKARQGDFTSAGRFADAPSDAKAFAELLAERHNGLTEAAIAVVPEIAGVLESIAVTNDCLLSRMSGSGATCFGLYADQQSARRAAAWLTRPGWWVAPAEMLNA
jgi:4-diphosphocytidyl-2-C-methyl-D-erythritol kinase